MDIDRPCGCDAEPAPEGKREEPRSFPGWPCPDLRCADPDRVLHATEEEQVLLVVEIGIAAALLDEHLSTEKSEAVVTAIRLLPGLAALSDQQLTLLLVRAAERTSAGNTWLAKTACALTSPALRRVAFRMAALFCAWDGVIDDREQGYLDFLARALGFSELAADELFAQATDQAGAVARLARASRKSAADAGQDEG